MDRSHFGFAGPGVDAGRVVSAAPGSLVEVVEPFEHVARDLRRTVQPVGRPTPRWVDPKHATT